MPGRRHYFFYILANSRRTVLDTGVTRDLQHRLREHRAGRGGRFTRRYQAHELAWDEVRESPLGAILREKQLKAGPRRAKIALISVLNPEWRDLGESL